MKKLGQSALHIPTILLPDTNIDMRRWAVIACDQFTSQRKYWDDLADLVSESPSTYHIIYPECYLSEGDGRIRDINRTMDQYKKNILKRSFDGFVLVERDVHAGKRLGLVSLIDLEDYDFSKSSMSQIRPTEETIVDRLPPRMKIREHASLEAPHIMLLVDDPNMTLIEPLYAHRDDLPLLYDFELYSGGNIRGYRIDADEQLQAIEQAMYALSGAADGMLFAAGDGNHSLATARQIWMNIRDTLSAEEKAAHPARYALVEICNLHDPAMAFEPIHRAVFGAEGETLLDDFAAWCKVRGIFVVEDNTNAQMQMLGRPIRIENAQNPLPVAVLQPFLDSWLVEHPDCTIDYIHGADALESLSEQGAHCILLSALDKYALFPAVRHGGPLPRKTFSLGEATDKRYYLECRALS